MRAYYNEHDPFAAAWLRNLISAGLIAAGDVDERSIVDVAAVDIAKYTQCHFFAGIGGWSIALRNAGWQDDKPVWTGSCPCQPFSLAGKQKGFADDRHLWPVFRELIAQRRPATIFGEQVASATEWLGLVRGDLEALEYAVGALPIQAASAGADHLRDRYWFVADANHEGSQGRRLLPERAGERAAGQDGVAYATSLGGGTGLCQGKPIENRHGVAGCCSTGDVPDAESEQARPSGQPRERECLDWAIGADGKARRVKPGVRLLAHGIPNRVGLLRGFGNAIDLRPAAAFIQAAMGSIACT